MTDAKPLTTRAERIQLVRDIAGVAKHRPELQATAVVLLRLEDIERKLDRVLKELRRG